MGSLPFSKITCRHGWCMSDHALFQLGCDKTVIVRIVRKSAVRAALDVFLFTDVLKRAATTIVERIERTITKKAVERSGSDIFVTREISTFRVFKKFVTVFHGHHHSQNIPIRAAIVRLRRSCFRGGSKTEPQPNTRCKQSLFRQNPRPSQGGFYHDDLGRFSDLRQRCQSLLNRFLRQQDTDQWP